MAVGNRVPKSAPKRATPLRITLVRVILAPLFLTVFLLIDSSILSNGLSIGGIVFLWLLFALIGVSDLLDGIVARKYKLVSDVGKLLDPLADVFSHVTYFICFVHADILWTWLCVIIVYRELVIIFVRMLLARRGVAFAAGSGGKLKTALFTAATIGGLVVFSTAILNLFPDAHRALRAITIALFIVATFVSYFSLIKYLLRIRSEKLFADNR